MVSEAPYPEPAWATHDAVCGACAYSLQGLTPPTRCPECGVVYSGRQFIIHGVPDSRHTMKLWHVALIVPLVLSINLLPLLDTFVRGWIFVTAGMVALIVLCVCLRWFAPRVGAGVSRLILDPGGVCIVPIGFDPKNHPDAATMTHLFTGNERVEIIPVRDEWARLVVKNSDGKPVFGAGIRVLPLDRPELTKTLQSIINETRRGSDGAATITPMTGTTTTTNETQRG